MNHLSESAMYFVHECKMQIPKSDHTLSYPRATASWPCRGHGYSGVGPHSHLSRLHLSVSLIIATASYPCRGQWISSLLGFLTMPRSMNAMHVQYSTLCIYAQLIQYMLCNSTWSIKTWQYDQITRKISIWGYALTLISFEVSSKSVSASFFVKFLTPCDH